MFSNSFQDTLTAKTSTGTTKHDSHGTIERAAAYVQLGEVGQDGPLPLGP
jgi:hypothetical protein